MIKLLNMIGGRMRRSSICPRLTFWLFYLAYKLYPKLGDKGLEHDFVLSRLTHTNHNLKVADVGGAFSLIGHELKARGYDYTCIDQIKPLSRGLEWVKQPLESLVVARRYDIALCISVIEHIGKGQYGSLSFPRGEEICLSKIHEILNPRGILILTTPHIHDKGSVGYSYNFDKIFDFLCETRFNVINVDYRGNTICVVAEKE